jgi:hypothetical protein
MLLDSGYHFVVDKNKVEFTAKIDISCLFSGTLGAWRVTLR